MQIHRRRILHQIRVHGVAARVHLAGDQHHVADLQRAHLLLRSAARVSTTSRPVSGKPSPCAMRSTGRDGSRYSHLRDRAARRVQPHAQPPERPAIVGHRNEETGGQPVGRGDLAADQRNFAAEAHRADAQSVGFLHDLGFELGQRPDRDSRRRACGTVAPWPDRSRARGRCRCKRPARPARSPVPAPATPRAGCTCARLPDCGRRGPGDPDWQGSEY